MGPPCPTSLSAGPIHAGGDARCGGRRALPPRVQAAPLQRDRVQGKKVVQVRVVAACGDGGGATKNQEARLFALTAPHHCRRVPAPRQGELEAGRRRARGEQAPRVGPQVKGVQVIEDVAADQAGGLSLACTQAVSTAAPAAREGRDDHAHRQRARARPRRRRACASCAPAGRCRAAPPGPTARTPCHPRSGPRRANRPPDCRFARIRCCTTRARGAEGGGGGTGGAWARIQPPRTFPSRPIRRVATHAQPPHNLGSAHAAWSAPQAGGGLVTDQRAQPA